MSCFLSQVWARALEFCSIPSGCWSKCSAKGTSRQPPPSGTNRKGSQHLRAGRLPSNHLGVLGPPLRFTDEKTEACQEEGPDPGTGLLFSPWVCPGGQDVRFCLPSSNGLINPATPPGHPGHCTYLWKDGPDQAAAKQVQGRTWGWRFAVTRGEDGSVSVEADTNRKQRGRGPQRSVWLRVEARGEELVAPEVWGTHRVKGRILHQTQLSPLIPLKIQIELGKFFLKGEGSGGQTH